ncbi:MAG: hypothetical protein EZS28_001711 [Streblomastix strix]|uniref:Uncharacterized protein n=1 Tax=Streblomastix strix TaxID=222440 RepID=A0A5J4X7Q8_9EUKA|nr:MAG: hypothetical protein EZS28_001711 [Streblomastix strix]
MSQLNSVPAMIMRFIILAMIHNVQFERKIEISQDDGDAELKVTKIPILFHSLLLNSLLVFDDIGSNADIQRFSSGLAKTTIHLVSDKNSANGDFAFSAESGTVRMYDQNQYNSEDIVPDQVTPASDANPQESFVTGSAGSSNEYFLGDHKHLLQVSSFLGVGKYGELWTNMDIWSNYLYIKQTNKSLAIIPLANVLSTDAANSLPTGYSISDNGNEGLRITFTTSSYALFCIDCARTSEQNTTNRGLKINADEKTFSLNGSVNAGTGTIGSANSGSVNYAAENPILLGVNIVCTEGEFYNDGAKVYCRIKPIIQGSVPPQKMNVQFIFPRSLTKPLKQLFTELAKTNCKDEDLIRTTIETQKICQ